MTWTFVSPTLCSSPFIIITPLLSTHRNTRAAAGVDCAPLTSHCALQHESRRVHVVQQQRRRVSAPEASGPHWEHLRRLAAAAAALLHLAFGPPLPPVCRYDSEEERFRARFAAASRSAAQRVERAAQAELLHAFRARQEARQQMQEGAVRAKLQQQQAWHGGEWQPGDAAGPGGRGPWQQEPDADAEARSRGWLRLLQQHESRWEALAARAGPPQRSDRDGSGYASSGWLSYNDVPWPPLEGADYLQGLAAWLQQHGQPTQQQQQRRQPGGERRAARAAYAHACRRWHPDKFEGRWGTLLAAADRGAILERVQQLSQAIIDAWEVQQQEAV